MVLGAAIVISLLGAWALGARAGRLADIRFAGGPLALLALAIQLAIFTPLAAHVPIGLEAPLHAVSYALLLAFICLNLRRPGMWLAALGLLANGVAIFANGGRMPVSLAAWKAAGGDPAELLATGASNNNGLATSSTHFAWLGDVFALPAAIPFSTAVSVGDVLILAGMTTFVYRLCGPRTRVSRTRTFAPLRFADFRRLLAARMVSKLGDWLTMAAVVTWIFATTRSTALVSAFLVARIVAPMLGGVVVAPLLDRVPHRRILSLVELTRALLAFLSLLLAARGNLAAVVALVCVSGFLGAATNPKAASSIPELLPHDLIHAGNGLHGIARQVVMLAGTALGGFATSEFGITTALSIDLATFLAASLLYLRFTVTTHEPREPDAGTRPSYASLFRGLARTPIVLALTGSFSLVTAAMGLLNASIPEFFEARLGEGDVYGYAMATIAAGLLCGELLTSFVTSETVARRSISLAFLGSAACLSLLALADVRATAFLMLFFLGVADGATEIVYDTLFQLELRRNVQAGVFALASSVQNGGMIVGLAAAPLLLAYASEATVIAIAAAGCLAGSLVAVPLVLARPGPARNRGDGPWRRPEEAGNELGGAAVDENAPFAGRVGPGSSTA